jgi:hypothetical protein
VRLKVTLDMAVAVHCGVRRSERRVGRCRSHLGRRYGMAVS